MILIRIHRLQGWVGAAARTGEDATYQRRTSATKRQGGATDHASTDISQLDDDPSTQVSDELSQAATIDPPLTAQQSQILDKILAGENFFFTGSAGTGKSVLLRAIIKAFRQREQEAKQDANIRENEHVQAYLRGDAVSDMSRSNDRVERWKLGVTASTGMAAVYVDPMGARFC